jgi:hypothetical protein
VIWPGCRHILTGGTKIQKYWWKLAVKSEMTEDTFQMQTDSDGVSYITMKRTESTENHQGGYKQSGVEYSDHRMYGAGVDTYQYYLSKRNRKCCRLFQTPLKNYQVSDSTWYKNEPMSKCTLGTIMQRISRKCDLSQFYTCHSVRVSTIKKYSNPIKILTAELKTKM